MKYGNEAFSRYVDEFSDQDGALVKDEEHPCAVVLQFPGKKR